jgi:hypothetical protein
MNYSSELAELNCYIISFCTLFNFTIIYSILGRKNCYNTEDQPFFTCDLIGKCLFPFARLHSVNSVWQIRQTLPYNLWCRVSQSYFNTRTKPVFGVPICHTGSDQVSNEKYHETLVLQVTCFNVVRAAVNTWRSQLHCVWPLCLVTGTIMIPYSNNIALFSSPPPPMALQPPMGPWPTSMKLSVSLRFS